MSIRRKIEQAIGTQPMVEIHVPPVDPGEEVVKGMDAWRSSATQLLTERNQFKERCEYLLVKLEVTEQTAERLDREHQSAREEIVAEREYWRKMALELIHANADLRNTVNGMKGFLRMADNTLAHTEQLQKQLKIESPPLELEASFDEQGVPVNGNGGAPVVSADQLKELIGRLDQGERSNA